MYIFEAERYIIEKKYEEALNDFLIYGLKLIVFKKDSEEDGDSHSVINLHIFQQICYHISYCLVEIDQLNLAKEYCDKALNTIKVCEFEKDLKLNLAISKALSSLHKRS